MILQLLPLIIGCTYAVIYCIRELRKYNRVKNSGHLVQAEVIGFNKDTTGDSVTYPAIVSYTTINGEKITATSKSSTGIKPLAGKVIMIVFSPNEPSDFYFQPSAVPYLMGICIFAFGGGLILAILGFF